VQVTSGTFLKAKMSRSVISEADESKQIVLACRCTPTSDLSLNVVGKMEKLLSARRLVDHEDEVSVAAVG
jgi:ferredoxin